MLREKGVVGRFVEFFGPALDQLALPTKAMIANMAPEYGATMGYFPVDDSTLGFLRTSGRTDAEVDLVERYCKEQGLFRAAGSYAPQFSSVAELDLSTVESSLAGPKRPQDRVSLANLKSEFAADMTKPVKERGFEVAAGDINNTATFTASNADKADYEAEIGHGAVAIAAITSCTNTSDPNVLITAGLLAKNAVAKGLKAKPYVKTSLAPGSRVVTEYLKTAGLIDPLEQLGFNNVGYGCTTCIGNSGPLSDEMISAINDNNLVVSAVLSGNRNFEGRVSPHTKANYLASPPLVVAFALAGTVDIDLTSDPIATNDKGEAVYLKDIWPTQAEVDDCVTKHVTADLFASEYESVFDANEVWNAIKSAEGDIYSWDDKSTYIQLPPFFVGLKQQPGDIEPINGGVVLALLGDSITTDHISPAGVIKADQPAGKYLLDNGVAFADFNSYGSRRGNDRVMTRGTFANIRLRNMLVPGTEGGITKFHPTGETMSIYDAAMRYAEKDTPLIIIAGKDYGMGSSRDWAAKGTMLLGVKAVLAESYERIHRSNLVGMGVLPLEFAEGDSRESLGLKGDELITIENLSNDMRPGQMVTVKALSDDGEKKFRMKARIDTEIEVDYYRHGGILAMVLRQLAAD
jgi:aconitate hydratase